MIQVNKACDKGIGDQDKILMKGIKHGYLRITIHDAEVVLIDMTEKLRPRRPRECICQ